MGDFNAHVGTDTDTLKGVIGKHGVTGLNENGRYLLQLCCSNGLRIMNTFFQHREVHKYTWYRPSMDQKSLIDFCIVSSDLFSDVLDVRVKRGAELSTDHHLVVCSLRLSKPWPNKRSNRSSVTYRIKWEALEDKEVRGGVEDTRLEAKAKDTKKIRGQGQGQGQPFRGQTLSRPRTGMLEAKAKDQGHKAHVLSKKKKGLHKNFSSDLH